MAVEADGAASCWGAQHPRSSGIAPTGLLPFHPAIEGVSSGRLPLSTFGAIKVVEPRSVSRDPSSPPQPVCRENHEFL